MRRSLRIVWKHGRSKYTVKSTPLIFFNRYQGDPSGHKTLDVTLREISLWLGELWFAIPARSRIRCPQQAPLLPLFRSPPSGAPPSR